MEAISNRLLQCSRCIVKRKWTKAQYQIRRHGTDMPVDYNKWSRPFTVQKADFDLEYLLNPANHEAIQRNIAQRKGVGDIQLVMELYNKIKNADSDAARESLHNQLSEALYDIPNNSHPDSPIGDESNMVRVDAVGQRRVQKDFSFPIKNTHQLGEELQFLRTSNVNSTTGHGSYFLTGQFAVLEQALVKYTVDHLLEQGFELVSVPDLLQPEIIEGCGFRTSGEVTQVYRLDSERHPSLCLAGTAEMALAGMLKDKILEEKDLPLRFAAVSRCYRAETSDEEKDLGIYRVHTFSKVEMFAVTREGEGDSLLQQLVDIQKQLFTPLNLHFKVLDMPTEELGAAAHRKFDIEAWMPAARKWGEISSASNCTDFQSRRLNIKYRTNSGQLKYCTTVNGTACAVPRTILALCDSHQNKDGTIDVPPVLRQYIRGTTVIQACDNVPHMEHIKSKKYS